jgi:hypothetical protein
VTVKESKEEFSITEMLNRRTSLFDDPQMYGELHHNMTLAIVEELELIDDDSMLSLEDGSSLHMLEMTVPAGREDIWARVAKDIAEMENALGEYFFNVEFNNGDRMLYMSVGKTFTGRRKLELSKRRQSGLTQLLEDKLKKIIRRNKTLYFTHLIAAKAALADEVNRIRPLDLTRIANGKMEHPVCLFLPEDHPYFYVQAVKDILRKEIAKRQYAFSLEIEPKENRLIVSIGKPEYYEKIRLGFS